MDQPGFFEVGERLARLSDLGDQLEAFARAVDFERSRPDPSSSWEIRLYGRLRP